MRAPLSSCAGYGLLYLYWSYNPLSPKAPRSLTKIGYHQWWGLIIMLWIPLTQALDTKSFYDNSREIKFKGSTQGASSQNFFHPTIRTWIYISHVTCARFFSYTHIHLQDIFSRITWSPRPLRSKMVGPLNRALKSDI